MSTAYSSAKQQYIGNGVTTEWGFDFPIKKHSELKVYLKRSNSPQVLLEEGVDYSFVTENTIAFPIKTGEAKLQASDVLALQRESVFESEYNFSNQQRLEPEEVMHADDNLERQIQELKRDSESAIKVLPTSNVDPNTFFEQVDRVYGSVDNIDTVANDKANVDAVAGSITNVNKTAGSIDNVNVVAPSIAIVNTVATNISSVNTAASNMAAIQYAPTAATNAAQSATNAANSATASANSATASATSANNSHIWAEGTDAQVAALGGVHSSKGWANQEANNYSVKAAGSTTSRSLKDRFADIINVKDFGAVGDGVTDDTTAIQTALNSAINKAVFFPVGVYIVSGLTCGTDVAIFGCGITNTQIKLKNGSTSQVLSSSNATHLFMKDIGFDGNKDNCPNSTNCVEIYGSELNGNGFWIENCGFFNANSIGLYQHGTYSKSRISNCVVEGNKLDGISANATNSVFEKNRCVGNGRFGILITGAWAQILENTCANNGQLVGNGAGIGVVEADYALAEGNNCVSNGVGNLFTHGLQFNTVNHGVMSCNYSQGNNGSGLDIYKSPYCTCSSNQTFANKVRGIEVDTLSIYSTITSNVVRANSDIGISVFNTQGTIVANNSVISNGMLGTVTNNLTGEANKPYGIYLWGPVNYGNYITITGNSISQNVGSDSNGVGLFIDQNCVGVTLTDNKFSGNTVNLSAVKTNFFAIENNEGIHTSESGAGFISDSSTSQSVTFATPLAFTPEASDITVNLTNSPHTNCAPMNITGVSSSGFTLGCYVAPGGSGLGFAWKVKI